MRQGGREGVCLPGRKNKVEWQREGKAVGAKREITKDFATTTQQFVALRASTRLFGPASRLCERHCLDWRPKDRLRVRDGRCAVLGIALAVALRTLSRPARSCPLLRRAGGQKHAQLRARRAAPAASRRRRCF